MVFAEAGLSKSSLQFPVIGVLITWLQKGRFSHAWVKVYYNGDWWVIDATSHTVRVRLFSDFIKENRVVRKYTLTTSEEKAQSIFWWGMKNAGKKYPKVEIFGNLIQLTVGLFGIKIKNPFGRGENYPRCNELVAMCLKELFDKEIKEDLDSIDLIWLDEYLKKNFT